MNKSELRNIIKEVIKETIRKVGDKYVVYPEKGGKRLGTHDTRAAAEKQLRAIHINKEDVSHRVKDYQQKPPVDWEKRNWELYENISYSKPNFEFEWNEAKRYPEFQQLGKEKWIKAANQGRTVSYSTIKNVLGNVDLNFKGLEKPKKQRFQAALEKGVVEMPIAIKFNDNDYDLVAGNTRLSGLVANGIDPKIWVVNVSNTSEDVHEPMNPGILKKRLGKLSCTKVRKARAKLKDKGTTYAKALQRYLNYHCQ